MTLAQEPHMLDRAKKLRQRFTPFEAKLWRRLSNSQLAGYKFRRQHVIDRCIVDFFWPQKSLIVEVDGNTHDAAKDAIRDELHEFQGYRTVRFTNADVGKNIEGVLERLLSELNATPDRWPHPSPSPEGEGK